MADLSLARRVNAALEAAMLAGPYQWGKHDCCTVAAGVIAAVTGTAIDMRKTLWAHYADLTHAEAERRAAADHAGGVRAAYERGIMAVAERFMLPYYGLPEATPGRPGDLIILMGRLRVGAEDRDPAALGTPMGYMGGDGEVYSWRSAGLARCAEWTAASRWRFYEPGEH